MKANVISKDVSKETYEFSTLLKVGDSVMITAGGNSKKEKILKGQVGVVKKILPKTSRVIIEGLNIVKRHKRAQNNQEESGIISKEGSLHISNVMFFSKKHNRPFRLKVRRNLVGDSTSSANKTRSERGFINPTTKEFEAVS